MRVHIREGIRDASLLPRESVQVLEVDERVLYRATLTLAHKLAHGMKDFVLVYREGSAHE